MEKAVLNFVLMNWLKVTNSFFKFPFSNSPESRLFQQENVTLVYLLPQVLHSKQLKNSYSLQLLQNEVAKDLEAFSPSQELEKAW